MPPKNRITRSAIVAAALELVRTQGPEALNARALAQALGCSTQPIFSNIATMEALRAQVVAEADALQQDYIAREVAQGLYPAYKASGMAYIRFAWQEPRLFRLLYMRDRTAEQIPQRTDLGDRMEGMVQDNTGLQGPGAQLFHLEMWAVVHGIAAMAATGYLSLEEDLVSRMLTDIYQGLKLRFAQEERQ